MAKRTNRAAWRLITVAGTTLTSLAIGGAVGGFFGHKAAAAYGHTDDSSGRGATCFAQHGQARAHSADRRPGGGWTSPCGVDRDLKGYEDIVRLRRGGANDVFLFTYADPTLKGAKGDGIGCVDATTARWIWRRAPIKGGRYTLIKAGQTAFVECSGYPEENHLAVHRISDGSVMGYPWKLGRLRDFAISGTTVAVVSVKLVADGEVRRV